MATTTVYNSSVFNDYWNVIKNWSNEWKDALVEKIVKSKEDKKVATKKHYDIDDIAGILASDASDEELLDEYLSEKYGV